MNSMHVRYPIGSYTPVPKFSTSLRQMTLNNANSIKRFRW